MMRRTWLQRLPRWAAALAPWLASAGARAQGTPQVWLRIRNSSQEAFTHVWQGLPQQGTDVDLGPLLPGDTSRWHALPATLAHYRKTRIQIGQRQFTHVTDTSFPGGRATLAPGSDIDLLFLLPAKQTDNTRELLLHNVADEDRYYVGPPRAQPAPTLDGGTVRTDMGRSLSPARNAGSRLTSISR